MAMHKEENELGGIEVLKDSSTFQLWDYEIRIFFGAKDLLDIVTGEEKVQDSDDADKKKKWETKDNKAKFYILRTLDRKVKMHILMCETSKEMYDKICAVYKRETMQKTQSLLQDFYNYKFDKNKDMVSNISGLENIVFLLNKAQPKNKITDVMVISKIMTILPDKYKHFEAAWDSTEEKERTMDNLIARLCKEEEKLKKDNKNEEKAAFKTTYQKNQKSYQQKVNAKQNKKGEDSTKKRCNYCERENHEEKNCLYKPIPGKENCRHCKKNNHASDKCFFIFEDKNVKRVLLVEIHFSDQSNENVDTIFAVDSACTGHMSHEKEILSNIIKIEDMKIKVAKKGQHIITNKQGTVETDSVILTEVMYTPSLSRNLFSVGAATSKGVTVIFDDEKVRMVNKAEVIIKGDVILEGEKSEAGLYLVDLKQTKEEALLTIKQEEDIDKWHKKLGHLNYTDMRKIVDLCEGAPEILKRANINKICEPCTLAKLVRNPFNSTRERATRPLEIIHTDLCGKISPETCSAVCQGQESNMSLEIKEEIEGFVFVDVDETSFQDQLFNDEDYLSDDRDSLEIIDLQCVYSPVELQNNVSELTKCELELSENEQKYSTCAKCSKRFISPDKLEKHLSSCVEENSKENRRRPRRAKAHSANCLTCQAGSTSLKSVRHSVCAKRKVSAKKCATQNAIRKKSLKMKREVLKNKPIKDVLVACFSCKVIFPSSKHVKSHCVCYGRRLNCTFCIVEPEVEKESYVCSTCEESFSNVGALRSHCSCSGQDICIECYPNEDSTALNAVVNEGCVSELSDEPPRNYFNECKICGDFFSNHNTLLIHEKKHMKIKCSNCERSFISSSVLRKHKNKCHKKMQSNHSSVTYDQNISRSKQRYRCGECDFGTNFRKSILKHMNDHSKSYPHVCRVCHKGFKHKWSMSRHEFLHSGLKPFFCSFCSASFADLANCKAHQKLHLGIKRSYKCSSCPREFSSRYQHRKHVREHYS